MPAKPSLSGVKITDRSSLPLSLNLTSLTQSSETITGTPSTCIQLNPTAFQLYQINTNPNKPHTEHTTPYLLEEAKRTKDQSSHFQSPPSFLSLSIITCLQMSRRMMEGVYHPNLIARLDSEEQLVTAWTTNIANKKALNLDRTTEKR